MKKLLVFPILFLWALSQAQEIKFFIETVSFPIIGDDFFVHEIEPQFTITLDDEEWGDFHHFSVTKKGFSALNGITINDNWYPYVFLSVNFDRSWYSSIGLSKDVVFGHNSCVVYCELGFYDIKPGGWNFNIGAIHSLEVSFKNKKRHPS